MQKVVIFLSITVAYGFEAGIRVKNDIGFSLGTKYYIPIPLNVSEATGRNWTLTKRPAGPLPSLVLYCPPERHMCALYDDTDYIAGVQVAIEADAISDTVLDWETQGFIKWIPSADDDTLYWAIQQYFVSEDFLSTSKEKRLASRNSEKILQQDGMWVTSFNRELMKIPGTSDELETSNFAKRTCIPGMGVHYYYNLTQDGECASDVLSPWFPLVYSGQLIGTIFNTYGKLPVKDNQTDWFERPTRFLVQVWKKSNRHLDFVLSPTDIEKFLKEAADSQYGATKASFPDAPECQLSWVGNPGQICLHIYYINDPWTMTCLFQ